mmetsp:Transcript_90772/g.270961  ORF Transcript_90772/g.270961 Transcript_90772/m.270961 type:complete len:237 (-) Transcript_90772:71-781(-)
MVEHLWRHEGRCPENSLQRGAGAVQDLCHSEVAQLDGAVLHQEVVGLDVPVHHVHGVDAAQRGQHLAEHVRESRLRQLTQPAEVRGESGVTLLHDDERVEARGARLQDPNTRLPHLNPAEDLDLVNRGLRNALVKLLHMPAVHNAALIQDLDGYLASVRPRRLRGRVHPREGSLTEPSPNNVLLVKPGLRLRRLRINGSPSRSAPGTVLGQDAAAPFRIHVLGGDRTHLYRGRAPH